MEVRPQVLTDPALLNHNVVKYLNSKSAFWLILVLGVVARILPLISLSTVPLASDALSYHKMAERIVLAENFSPYFPPGLPYYLSIWYFFFGSNEFIGRLSMILIYILVATTLYLVAEKLASRRAANLSVLMISFYPAFILQSIEPLTQLPAALCLVALVYLLLDVPLSSPAFMQWLRPIIIGILLAFVTLIRPSCLLLVIAVPIFGGIRSRMFWPSVTAFLVAAIIISVWLHKAHDMTGRFVMINDANALNFFFGNNPYTPIYKTWWFGSHSAGDVDVPSDYTAMYQSIRSLPPAERDAKLRQIAIDHITSRPDLFLLRTINRIRVFFAFDSATGSSLREAYSFNTAASLTVIAIDAIAYFTIMLLAIFFMFIYRGSGFSSEHFFLLLGMILIYSMPYWISFSHPAYHTPIVPILAVLAGIAGDELMKAQKRSLVATFWFPKSKRYALLACLAVFLLIQTEWVLFNLSRI